MKEREIAVRGYINEKFGTTYGKGLFHKAIFNGSVEIRNPYTKYLIDLFEYRRWEATAKSDPQAEWVHRLREVGVHQSPDAIVSWLQHYDPITKVKTPVNGMCVYLPEEQELAISVDDPEHNVVDHWTLSVKPCAKAGGNIPVFVAANFDLAH